MIKAIPKRLLPHQIILQKYNGYNRGNTYGEDISIRYVKVDLTTKVLKKADGTEVIGAGMLFFDCTNSMPNNITFTEGDLIKFNGLTYTISSIDTLYANSQTPHHCEIYLV